MWVLSRLFLNLNRLSSPQPVVTMSCCALIEESRFLSKKQFLAPSNITPHERRSARTQSTVLHCSLENNLERKLLEAPAIRRIMPEINNKDELMDTLRLVT
ncbi:hypothetical protein Y032_0901g2958 [Ancylostoma ceylanicum]|uniref:Uncharacterized protein n=1 Tax=Ancylostoma ceylanicum TaxID=53326 RepID=A0A016W961_9BILA|nr:hypothetical protein Y032_0901g2958 [Ancylostoma ceylanicum]